MSRGDLDSTDLLEAIEDIEEANQYTLDEALLEDTVAETPQPRDSRRVVIKAPIFNPRDMAEKWQGYGP